MELSDPERAMLRKFVELAAADDEGAWNFFHHEIVEAGMGAGARDHELDPICRNLRRRKLLAGQGTGRLAAYWPTDKGKQAVA